jgi:hypothetical protein
MERSETTAMLTMLETTTDRLAPSTSHAGPPTPDLRRSTANAVLPTQHPNERSPLWHTTAP